MELTMARPWWAAGGPEVGRDRANPWYGLSEPELVARALGGRPEAYGELVRRHQAAVFNVALRLVGEREEALDLAQEAFVRAYQALGSFDRARPFGPWINRIAANLALTWRARRRVATVPLAAGPPGEMTAPASHEVPDYSTEPERLYLASEEQARLRQAILALVPRYRLVIELRHFQDLSYADIAATLAVPISDVKSDLFRARRLLRERLGEPG